MDWRHVLGTVLVLLALGLPAVPAVPQFNIAREQATRPDTFFYHVNDGYHYHENQNQNQNQRGTTYFKCVYYERGCRGRARLDDFDGFVQSGEHTHDPDLLYPDEMALRRNILERCRRLEFPNVVDRVTYNRMRTPMRNARLSNFPPLPHTLHDLSEVLRNPQYEVITMTDDGQDNLYGGTVIDVEGVGHVVFMSDRMLQSMRDFSVLHSDGTFRAVPVNPDFATQVFCIIGVWNDHIIPLAWVLMGSVTEAAYTAVLMYLRQRLGDNIELTRAITDYEVGQQNAWAEVFGVRVTGCLWHLTRSFMRNVVEYGLQVSMRNIPEVRHIIRLTFALGLLPEGLISIGFRVIVQHARREGNFIFRRVRPYLQYIWRFYVRRDWMRRRMSVYGSVQRTNNCCEAQNRMLRERVGVHPDVYRFLAGLVALEQQAWNLMLALDAGRRPNGGRRRTSVTNDERIRNVNAELLNPPGNVAATVYRFLRNASMAMEGMVREVLNVI